MYRLNNLFVVFGPSGAGKTSLVKALVEQEEDVVCTVSCTTRAPRPGEEDGKDYIFLDKADFQARVERGEFLEHAEVFGNFYGTSADQVKKQLASGVNVVLEIDWQGAAQIQEQFPDCVRVCVLPPSRASLEERLNSRGQDSQEVIRGRMEGAKREISHYGEADFLIINDAFDRALDHLKGVIRVGSLCQRTQSLRLSGLIDELLA